MKITLKGTPEELKQLVELFQQPNRNDRPAVELQAASPKQAAKPRRKKSRSSDRSDRSATDAAAAVMDSIIVETMTGAGKKTAGWDTASLTDDMIETIVSVFHENLSNDPHAYHFLRMVYEAGESGISGKKMPGMFGVTPQTFRAIVGNLGSKIRRIYNLDDVRRPTELLVSRRRTGKDIIYTATPLFAEVAARRQLFDH